MNAVRKLLDAALVEAVAGGEPDDLAKVAECAAEHAEDPVAVEALRRLEASRPGDEWMIAKVVPVWGRLGARKEIKRIERAWTRSRWVDPQKDSMWQYFAMAYEHLGDVRRADVALGRSGNPHADEAVAEIAEAAGRHARAEELYARPLEPRFGVSLARAVALVRLAHARGDRKAAAAAARRAIRDARQTRMQTSGEPVTDAAIALARLGHRAAATKLTLIARDAVVGRRDRYGDPWHLGVADAWRAVGRSDEAEAMLAKVRAGKTHKRGHAAVASALATRGKPDRARRHVAAALRELDALPSTGKAGGGGSWMLAKALAALGDLPAAVEQVYLMTNRSFRAEALIELARTAAAGEVDIDALERVMPRKRVTARRSRRR